MSNQEISHHKKDNIDLVSEASMRNHHIEFIPISPHDEKVETIIASKCVDAAISRHVGTLKGVYTPIGMMYHQVGKDLTETKYFIGTGGVVIHSKNPIEMMKDALYSDKKPMELRPKHPIFMLDRDYILSAMGLLSLEYPEIALRIMKKRIVILGEKHAS